MENENLKAKKKGMIFVALANPLENYKLRHIIIQLI